jgi:hypothetical protein
MVEKQMRMQYFDAAEMAKLVGLMKASVAGWCGSALHKGER